MKKNRLGPIFIVCAVMLSMTVILVSISLYKSKTEIRREIGYHLNLSNIEAHRPLVEKYAAQHGLEDEVETLLAIMMQESGGKGKDPMQASESLCGEVGCIEDPEESIAQGVAYFKESLDKANGDRKLAIQSYNFGLGFIAYALEHAGKYTPHIAIQFSQEMYEKAEDPSRYTCLRKEAKQYDACYGDILYVRDVLGYRDIFLQESKKTLAKSQSSESENGNRSLQ